MMLTTLPQAHPAGRARLGVAVRPISQSWRLVPVASAHFGCRTSGLAPFGTNGYAVNGTIQAADPVFMAMTTATKRPARHLATRTT